MNKKQLKVIGIILFAFLFFGGVLGYRAYQDIQEKEKEQQLAIETNKQLAQEDTIQYVEITGNPSQELHDLTTADIKSVVMSGDTGGAQGSHEHTFSDAEIESFIKLLNEVQLGEQISEEKAISVGAVSNYTITNLDNSVLLISSGTYFKVNNQYYEFSNKDELWNEFISFNSLN